MHLRRYHPGDNPAILALFHDTVHTVNARDYPPEQLAVWAPCGLDADVWCSPFTDDDTYVVESGGEVVGFANLRADGYLDRLYVHHSHQRRGVATLLADQLEDCARRAGLPRIRADASITAKPFFEQRAYRIVRENAVRRGDQVLTNYTMVKELST